MKIVIPMAGRGQRFIDAGYINPKPLIDINGKPMIKAVIDNIGLTGEYIFICQKDHIEKYDLNDKLPEFCGNNPCTIVPVEEVTQGAACTVLLAEEYLKGEVVIANSDQLVKCSVNHFVNNARAHHADGSIITFTATEPKWSFVRMEGRLVVEVAEKNPISNIATAGVYYFADADNLIRCAKSMISKNIRTNNEFYVCPIFNELILLNNKVINYHIYKMHGLGTPEDLQAYLEY